MVNPVTELTVPETDLQDILQRSDDQFQRLAGQRLFMTGATGFFGVWLLEAIAYANREIGRAPIEVVALTRQPAAFADKYPQLAANPSFSFHAGDIRQFEFPAADFDYMVHGATTSARETFEDQDALLKFDTVAGGTRRLLEFAASARPKTVLYLGSGACYGRQPEGMTHIPERYSGTPLPEQANSALGIGKRAAEFYANYFSDQHQLDVRIARCFTFYGPHLPIDIHYAIGNFIRDGLNGHDIVLTGDGSPERSYLYVADLVSWLLSILLDGPANATYNVGDDKAVTIGQLAHAVAEHFDVGVQLGVQTGAPGGGAINRYVPDVSLARDTLGLNAWTDFSSGLARMANHVREHPQYYR